MKGAAEHNLRDVDAAFPLGCFIAVTGVSGSGKSTLVNDILYAALARELNGARIVPGKHTRVSGMQHLDKVVHVDQGPIGRTPRSNPATYTGRIRPRPQAVRADHRGQGPRLPAGPVLLQRPGRPVRGLRRATAPSRSRCSSCRMCTCPARSATAPGTTPTPCRSATRARQSPTCSPCPSRKPPGSSGPSPPSTGTCRPWSTSAWATSASARAPPPCPAARPSGSSSPPSCSAATGRHLYVLDEPTTGLHFDDIRKLLGVLNRLADAGNTVIVIEHNLDVIKTADWVIDLGPDGGSRGGTIIATGTPEQIAATDDSYTGQYLKKLLGV